MARAVDQPPSKRRIKHEDSGIVSEGLLYVNCLRSVYDTKSEQIDRAVSSQVMPRPCVTVLQV